jgi:alpha-beta hydrolase superfamily lysophospholipase
MRRPDLNAATQPPVLDIDAGARPEAVVLVLHGGREHSYQPVRARQLAVLRMAPFARRIRQHGQGRVVVARLRYRVRGWNAEPVQEAAELPGEPGRDGTEPGPVQDAHWALRRIGARFPDLPIAVIGHSMGGRTALRIGGADRVQAVAGLAPWLSRTEPSAQLAGRRVLLMHGTADRMTDPSLTTDFAERLQSAGVATSLIRVSGETHPMLKRPRLWHELASQFALASVLAGYQPSGWAGAPNDWREVVQATARITY